jgi:2-polyprenyl-3-methyl-5-hydroxy-6-metoxy-1,4-benzoquinol methylase
MNQTLETKAAFERPQWYLEGRDYNIRLRAEVVRHFVGDRKLRSMVDIGCGSGAISLPLLNAGSELTLVDLSSKMLEIARSRVPEDLRSQVRTVNSDFLNAKLEPKSFDLVICLGVVAYIEDLAQFATKLTTLLAPGGLLMLECSNSRHLLSLITAAYSRCHSLLVRNKVPVILRSSAQIRRAMEERGVRLTNSYQYSLPLPIVQKCFSQEFHYRTIRRFFGFPPNTRNAWLGNECIFTFTQ